jgi:putative peptidoglycan lipid II flippase
VLTSVREKDGDAAARSFFRALRGLSLVVLAFVSVLGVVFAPWLVELFASGYAALEGQFERTVTLTRWVFPYIFFMGTAALGAAVLNAHRRFAVAAFAPGLLNVAFIALAIALPPWLGAHGYEIGLALVVGALVGGVLQVVVQWPSLRGLGYLERPSLELGHPAVREVLRRMGPALVGIGVYALDVLLARRFLSDLGLGAQSYFNWAARLCDFPQGIFVMALQTAALPSLALLATRGDRIELGKTFAFGMRFSLFVAIPATALLVGLAEPLVVLLFQRGEFDAVAARETARSLVAQGAGIALVAACRQLVAVYYAIGDTRTPVVVAASDLAVFVALAFGLRGPLGHVGIGWAVSGASFAQALLLWVLLARKVPIRGHGLFGSILKVLFASLGAVAVARFVVRWLAEMTDDSPLGRALPGLGAALAFGVVYLTLAAAVRSPELAALHARIRRRTR